MGKQTPTVTDERLAELKLKRMETLNTSIDVLELTQRYSDAYKKNGFQTIGDLLRHTETEMLRVPTLRGAAPRNALNQVKTNLWVKFGELDLSFGLK